MYRISFLIDSTGSSIGKWVPNHCNPGRQNAQQANTQQHGKCNSEAVSSLVGKVATPNYWNKRGTRQVPM